jgi:hypothetical protein
VGSAVQQRLCTVDQLTTELRDSRPRGRTLLRSVLAEVADGIRSAPEGELRTLIMGSGLPVPLFNPDLYLHGEFLARPDAWWPEAGLAAEVDSKEFHLLPGDWEKTMRRHRRMTAAGILVLHISPGQLRTEPRQLVTEIAEALTAGRPLPGITAKPLGSDRRVADSADLARPAAGQLVWPHRQARLVLGPLGRQFGQRAFDFLPDPAERDAEDALATLQQVDDLIRRGALVHADAVTHQSDLGQVGGPAVAQMLDRGPDLLQGDTSIEQALYYLEYENVAEAVQPLGT